MQELDKIDDEKWLLGKRGGASERQRGKTIQKEGRCQLSMLPCTCVSHHTLMHSLPTRVKSPSSRFPTAPWESYIFNLFLHWWTSRLPPGFGYYNVVINNHLCITAGLDTLISPKMNSQIWRCWIKGYHIHFLKCQTTVSDYLLT